MGQRGGVVEHEEGLARLSLAELDAEIDRCRIRLKIAPITQSRKSFESRIHWLERFRLKHHAE
jgi:hypothetical protein